MCLELRRALSVSWLTRLPWSSVFPSTLPFQTWYVGMLYLCSNCQDKYKNYRQRLGNYTPNGQFVGFKVVVDDRIVCRTEIPNFNCRSKNSHPSYVYKLRRSVKALPEFDNLRLLVLGEAGGLEPRLLQLLLQLSYLLLPARHLLLHCFQL